MEENQNDNQQNIHEFFKKLLFERDEQIRKLQQQVEEGKPHREEQEQSDNVWRDKYHATLDSFEATQKADAIKVNSLQNQINGLNDLLVKVRAEKPSSNRQKKTGNWMWTLAFCGLGAILGFFAHKWFFVPKDTQAIAFQNFKDENQFNFEFELSKGRIADVEKTLETMMADEKNLQLTPQIEFTKKLLGAARRKFEEQGFKPEDTGIALEAPSDEPVVVEETKKTLSVTESKLTMRAEATTKSDKIGTLTKDVQVTIMDRTNSYDKLSINIDGQAAIVRDYWYKVETKEGLDGWVFGYFTTRSRKNIEFEAPKPDTTATKPAPSPVLAPVKPKKDTTKTH